MDMPDLRTADKTSLAHAMQDARDYTIGLLDELEALSCRVRAGDVKTADPLNPPCLAIINPSLWELGHVAGEDIITAMVVATGKPNAMIGDLLPDEFLLLVATVMEVNGDFFAQRVAPLIMTIQAKADAAMKTMAGATSSPPSSDTATT